MQAKQLYIVHRTQVKQKGLISFHAGEPPNMYLLMETANSPTSCGWRRMIQADKHKTMLTITNKGKRVLMILLEKISSKAHFLPRLWWQCCLWEISSFTSRTFTSCSTAGWNESKNKQSLIASFPCNTICQTRFLSYSMDNGYCKEWNFPVIFNSISLILY